jgi:hypothetical protein
MYSYFTMCLFVCVFIRNDVRYIILSITKKYMKFNKITIIRIRIYLLFDITKSINSWWYEMNRAFVLSTIVSLYLYINRYHQTWWCYSCYNSSSTSDILTSDIFPYHFILWVNSYVGLRNADMLSYTDSIIWYSWVYWTLWTTESSKYTAQLRCYLLSVRNHFTQAYDKLSEVLVILVSTIFVIGYDMCSWRLQSTLLLMTIDQFISVIFVTLIIILI